MLREIWTFRQTWQILFSKIKTGIRELRSHRFETEFETKEE